MKLNYIYVLTFVLTTFAVADDCADGDSGNAVGGAAVGSLVRVAERMPAGGCPKVSSLVGICNDIYSRTEDTSNAKYWAYSYEKKIYEAACVDFNTDTPMQARQKLQDLWNNHQEKFKCDAANFRVSNGSILKYAVEMRSYSIVENAVKSWKLNLNHIDSTDNKTLLDFIKGKLDQNRGTPNEKLLQDYFNLLRRNGAKFRNELSV